MGSEGQGHTLPTRRKVGSQGEVKAWRAAGARGTGVEGKGRRTGRGSESPGHEAEWEQFLLFYHLYVSVAFEN